MKAVVKRPGHPVGPAVHLLLAGMPVLHAEYLHYHILWVTKTNKVTEAGSELYVTELAARQAANLSRPKQLCMIKGCLKDCREETH